MEKHWYVSVGQYCNIYKKCAACGETKHRQKGFYPKSGNSSAGVGKGKQSPHKTSARCRKCDNKRKYLNRKWKKFLIDVWGQECHYCKRETEYNHLGLDHKIPVSKGGEDDISNLVLCCNACNTEKSDMSYEEYMELCYNPNNNNKRSM
jgi:5-methylcytosine-specific restriction endonuclease McrA